MLNQTGSRDLILSTKKLITILRKPGEAFVFAKLTLDDVTVVKIDKSSLIKELQEWPTNTIIECHQDTTGIYIGW